jgi:acetolactate synthase-1/2/3 large subunit
MKGTNLLVAALENEGVKQIFGVPGEENLDIVEALSRSTIKLVVTRHEQAAALMAATHGRLTGKVDVCPSTLGPGALDLTTGVAYAQLELPTGNNHALAGHQFCGGSQVPCGVR